MSSKPTLPVSLQIQEGLDEIAAELNEFADEARALVMILGYYDHDSEFDYSELTDD